MPENTPVPEAKTKNKNKKRAMHVMKREVVLALSLNHPETGSIRLD